MPKQKTITQITLGDPFDTQQVLSSEPAFILTVFHQILSIPDRSSFSVIMFTNQSVTLPIYTILFIRSVLGTLGPRKPFENRRWSGAARY